MGSTSLGVASEAGKELARHSPGTLPDRPGRHGHNFALLRLLERICVTVARRVPVDSVFDRIFVSLDVRANFVESLLTPYSKVGLVLHFLFIVLRKLVQLHAGQLELARLLRLDVACDL